MKRKTLVIIGLAAACAGCLVLGACTSSTVPEEYLTGAPVRFDSNGGIFASQEGVDIVDVYPLDAAREGIKLVEPGSDDRGSQVAAVSDISRAGYFLAGWYTERTMRTDEAGTPLDEYGNVCSLVGTETAEDGTVTEIWESEAGLAPGYMYSGRWNFEEDVFTVAEDYSYEEDGYALILYAAWIPNFVYQIYAEDANGNWVESSSLTYDPTVEEFDTLALPVWDDWSEENPDATGGMLYGSFPRATDTTLEALYADPGKTQLCEGSIAHRGEVDLEHGIATNVVTPFYAELRSGIWYHIHTAQQFANASRSNGCYEIYADLDFEGLTWGFTGDFSGVIEGNGHTISNITARQTNNSVAFGGLFGRINESASITDITFENVSFTMAAGSRTQGAYFGLFAGYLNANATIKNVSVSGVFVIGDVYPLTVRNPDGTTSPTYEGYSVGLLTGNNNTAGIEYDIAVDLEPAQSGSTTRYTCTVTVNTNTGVITIGPNNSEDQSVKPEITYISAAGEA